MNAYRNNATLSAGEFASWYAPWRNADPSWMASDPACNWIGTGASDEVLLRARYPAWCRRFSLPVHPDTCVRSIWWSLYALEREMFARVCELAGLVMALAANRRDSLVLARSAAARLQDTADVRWALQRAALVPKQVLELRGADGGDESQERAAASLAFAVSHAVPSLNSRMAMRHPRERAAFSTPRIDGDEAGRCVRWLERLWFDGYQRAGTAARSAS